MSVVIAGSIVLGFILPAFIHISVYVGQKLAMATCWWRLRCGSPGS